ncbi:MAG: RagB/SusD family nutrient uptake outer membrane protein [Bacteroidales bacterium]|nr:RagB/SusD family nutrient uptake outer membrane protein [Bacteroidales bacterium]
MKLNTLTLLAASTVAFSTTLSSCLETPLPQTNGATQEQVEQESKDGLANAVASYMHGLISDDYTDIGYPQYMIIRDVLTADMPVLDPSYYYWYYYCTFLYMGDYAMQTYWWSYYNGLILDCNLLIKSCDRESATDAQNLATGCAYRAFTMFEMARMYEFKQTGTSLDAEYYDKLRGLTVPLVNENVTEEQSFNNPRAPFYEMYRFILTDLNVAEDALNRASSLNGLKTHATPGMVYGLKARVWLELATRFDRFPDDLETALAHEDEQYYDMLGDDYTLDPLGVKTANEAYQKAAEYARLAINQGYSVLTESEWHNPNTGFNSDCNSWIWLMSINSNNQMVTYYTWRSWVSYMCPEATYGLAHYSYNSCHCIDAALFERISSKDWRKTTWIDPDDFEAGEEVFNEKYADKVNLSYDEWQCYAPYVGFKFHPCNGDGSSSTAGNGVDIPLMRVEEMYFIEAEAKAHYEGLSSGVAALTSFLNTYRYTDGSYTSLAYNMDDFTEDLLKHKRIEFWGEGLVLFDFRRLGKAITRGYTGSNHPKAYQYNSIDGYVAPWSTLFIPRREANLNTAVLINPDPSSVSQTLKWSE